MCALPFLVVVADRSYVVKKLLGFRRHRHLLIHQKDRRRRNNRINRLKSGPHGKRFTSDWRELAHNFCEISHIVKYRTLGADVQSKKYRKKNAHDELVNVVSLQGLNGYGLKVLVSIEHEARGDEDLALKRNTQGMGEHRMALEIEENSLGEAHLVAAALYGKLADEFMLSGRSSDAIQDY
ncbi:hypothetical protein IV203_010142 [Nitzschia inconspicua]|uniref:Uncharacterized protein n=1 Tax=Nitzschia inconspicua TaxID=303405 RepID=A0A9K3KWH4_9STRA|nr:hypothetical protein IV203_010142 [Nitzschia inconspicua]